MIVDANVWPPSTTSCAFVKDRLKASVSLMETIETWVTEVPNLDKLITSAVRAAGRREDHSWKAQERLFAVELYEVLRSFTGCSFYFYGLLWPFMVFCGGVAQLGECVHHPRGLVKALFSTGGQEEEGQPATVEEAMAHARKLLEQARDK